MVCCKAPATIDLRCMYSPILFFLETSRVSREKVGICPFDLNRCVGVLLFFFTTLLFFNQFFFFFLYCTAYVTAGLTYFT